MTNILVTGAAGFAGSHFCEHVQAITDWHIHAICSFRHRGDTRRLEAIKHDRITLHAHDLTQPIPQALIDRIGPIEHVFHFAAESHVDRSLDTPQVFIHNNVDVTLSMLEYARLTHPKTFFQISTDEVYGPAPNGTLHKEWSPIIPSNPYSASKACQEAIAISYWRSYGVPLIITNTMNLIGERQDIEKFVPKTLRAVLLGEEVTIHGSPGDIGSRFYLHARNQSDALIMIARRGIMQMHPEYDRPFRANIVGDVEMDNLAMAEMIALYTGKPLKYKLVEFHKGRPGHDRRYALDGSLLRDMGWKAPVPFEDSVAKLVKWYIEHSEWLEMKEQI